jgi:hypothetical protein
MWPPSFAYCPHTTYCVTLSFVLCLTRNFPLAIMAALAVGSTVGWVATLLLATNASPATLDGLTAPRGLTATSDGFLLIAEGGAGRLLRWDLSGAPEVISDAFPYLSVSGIQGESASGISAALQVDGDSYLAIVGEARAHGHQELYRLTPPGQPLPVTGQDVQGFFPPQPITNPYDLVLTAGGDVLVTDSGRNSVIRITREGEIYDYAFFPDILISGSKDMIQAVPTGAAWGPDGALYVATLTGWPHPAGAATVYRVADTNADGDATDEGEVTSYLTGFSAATDLVFEADGSLLVTEFSTQMKALVSDLTLENAADLPGRLVRRGFDGIASVVAGDLVGPTAVAVLGDRVFVSEEFAGRVIEVGGTDQRVLSAFGWVLSIVAGIGTTLLVGGALLAIQQRYQREENLA